jgi:hypothetical protein
MNPIKISYLFLIFFLLVSTNSYLYSEKIITSKTDEPDAFYGLKIGGIATPTFGYRIRDNASGTSNAALNDRTGFSMPWTLLMISKEWEEKGMSTELWGEVTRNSNLSSDTSVNGGNKSNSYVLQVRRANVQKFWNIGSSQFKLILGIQELPHVYTQWKENWRWRYIDRAPMESLSFAPQPSDIGISAQYNFSLFQFYLGVMNGEGYREMQNTDSSGFDVYSRVSIEKETENWKWGIHLIGRLGNFMGQSGNECFEGKTKCLSSDGNLQTALVKDLRSQKTENIGLEWNLQYKEILNFGFGGIHRKKHGGVTFDRANLSTLPTYEKDLTGRAVYVWGSVSLGQFTLGYRREDGTGSNGVLGVFNSSGDGFFHYANPNSYYRSKENFRRHLVFVEYNYDSNMKFAIGYAEVRNFDSKGSPNKIYLQTNTGLEATERQYLDQYRTGVSSGIVSYLDRQDRQFFLKAMLSF